MTDLASYELNDQIAVITLDDGKANAFGPNMIGAVNAMLDRAASEAKVVLFTGRPGIFSGGFDLKVIRGGDPQAAHAMRLGGTRLMMRLYGLPQPLVIAAPGHAIALGAFCLLTADYRVGVDGAFNIGLNENRHRHELAALRPHAGPGTALQTLPGPRRHRRNAIRPSEAKDAGFLDEVVAAEDLLETALAAARRLADWMAQRTLPLRMDYVAKPLPQYSRG